MRVLLVIFTLLNFDVYAQGSSVKNRMKNFRDPFKRTIQAKMKSRRREKKIRTVFTNKVDPFSIQVEELRIIGVFLGRDRRAVGKIISNEEGSGKKGNNDEGDRTIIIREGMKIGPDRAEVKAILPGGIVLVEKVFNVYDEVEYLETIIPVAE